MSNLRVTLVCYRLAGGERHRQVAQLLAAPAARLGVSRRRTAGEAGTVGRSACPPAGTVGAGLWPPAAADPVTLMLRGA